ncbi:hypothetical protein [Streptomyces anthocyanicus]
MPAATLLRQPLRTLIVAATVPLAQATLSDYLRIRGRLNAERS